METVLEDIQLEDKPGFIVEDIFGDFRVITRRIESSIPIYRTQVVLETLDIGYFPAKRLIELEPTEGITSNVLTAMEIHDRYLKDLKETFSQEAA